MNPIPLRIVLMEHSRSSLTSFLERHYSPLNDLPLFQTIGVDFYSKLLTNEENQYKLEILFVTIDEKFKNIVPVYFYHTRGAIVLFDSGDDNTISKIRKLSHSVRNKWVSSEKYFPMLLVFDTGICDHISDEIWPQMIRNAEDMGFNGFCEISINCKRNIDNPFSIITRLIVNPHLPYL